MIIFLKIIKRLKRLLILFFDIPHILWLNVTIARAHAQKRPVFLIEITTAHDIFCIYNVIKGMYERNALIVYSSKDLIEKMVHEQIAKEFHPIQNLWIDVVWTNWIFGIDFYMNTTLSYDIHVPTHARYTINFPHTITSKTKYDVFSPAIKKISDTIITGQAYEKDLLTYCKDFNIKKIPTMHRLGGPKSDNLFTHAIDKKAFIESLGLDAKLPTVFYGPTYNQGASVFNWLEDILKITEKHAVNLIIKIHPGAYRDPTNKKSSGGIDWKTFFEQENLRNKHIYNVINKDSTDFIMASDITITDISTIWIEFYFLRKQMIFLDIPEFFKDHEMNSLGDFRQKYGYLVKNADELYRTIAGLLSGEIQKKTIYDIDDLLLYNKGHATEATINRINELYKNEKR